MKYLPVENITYKTSIFLIPFGMLLFGYVLTMGAFKYESKRSKKDLADLLKAEIVKEPVAF